MKRLISVSGKVLLTCWVYTFNKINDSAFIVRANVRKPLRMILSFFLVLLMHNGYSQTGFSEDWESPDWNTKWTVSSSAWEVGIPTSGPNAAHGGTKCAATVLAGNYASGVDSRLISPIFAVPAANQNPRLRFWHWFSTQSGPDYGKVQIKVAGNSTWIDIGSTYSGSGSGIWTYPSIDLSAYAGQNVQIAFLFHSDGSVVSSGWYIDDISVETGPIVFNNPETWEDGIGDWSSERGTWEVGIPTSGPNAAHGGTKSAATVLAGNYAGGVDSKLISPIFAVPAANQNPRLRFWHWFSTQSGPDYGKVQIKVAGNSTWIDIGSTYSGSGSSIWTYPSIDLSAYAGQNVQIAFLFHSDGSVVSSGWYIDDISVETGPIVFNNPETWEDGIGDWSSERGTWEVGIPTSGPNAAHGGTKCAATVLAGNYAGGVDSKLISPIFAVPAANQNPRLRFWHWFSTQSGPDYGKVQIKVAGNSTWIDIGSTYSGSGSSIWTYPSIDLSAYAGQNVQIAFLFHSDGSVESSGWYIDDISVETGPIVFNNPETWEDGIGDWSSERGTWEVGIPTSGPNAAHGGTKCAATVLAGNYAGGVDSKLISPIFAVPAANQNPRLRFWHWFSTQSGPDYGKVQIKVAGNSTWIDIGSTYSGSGSGIWTYPSIDLSAYAGQNVQIAFLFHSDGSVVSSGWYIDDISVETGPIVFNNPETWEDGIGDWSSERGTWEVGIPTSGPNAAHGGTKCAATVLAGNYAGGVDSKLISSIFAVPAANQNPRLRFWHWFSTQSGPDYGKVQIKVAGNSTWIDIGSTYSGSGSSIWTYPSIDLSAYAGQNVQIAFLFHSDGSVESSGWYIDDISVETGPIVFNNPETWEDGIGDWSSERGTWEVGIPTSGPNAAHGGTKCAATVLAGNYAGGVDSKLISPIFAVPAANQNPRLRFWHWFSTQSGPDYGKVQIKVAGNSTWIDIGSTYSGSGSGIWTYPSIDLSAYAGQNVQIAFLFHSDGSVVSSGWYIDDISVETGPIVFNNPETWEDGIGDWSSERGTWEVGIPTSGPNAAHGGTKCAATVLAGNYAGGVDSKLISPIFAVPAANQNPRLRFWHWFSTQSGPDYGKVQIKVAGNSTWIDIGSTYSGSGSGIWTYPSIDLSAYAGQNVQIAFLFHSDGSVESSGWYIDDIAIVNETTTNNAVTFTVDMSTASGFNPDIDEVYISGSFPDANWNIPGTNPSLKLQRIEGSLIYSVTVQLAEGTYQYKYYKNTGLTGVEWAGSANRSITVKPPVTIEDTWGGILTFYNLQSPGSGIIEPCDPYVVVARAGIPNNKTGTGGPAYGLKAWIGYSTEDTHPATWTNWVEAPYFGLSGSYDEFRVNIGNKIPFGKYYYASRFKLGNNNYVYGGYNSGSWNYTTNKSGVVTVNPSIIPTITGSNFLCEGSTGITYTTENGMTTYNWMVSEGGIITSGAGTSTITVNWNSSGVKTVSLNYRNLEDCSQSVITALNVTVNPLPVPAISGISSVCQGSTGIVYSTTPGMSNYTWTVSSGGVIVGSNTGKDVTVNWNIAGSRWVRVNYTNANGCRAASPSQFKVTVNPLPIPTISGMDSVCEKATDVIYTTEGSKTNYVWSVSAGGTLNGPSNSNLINVDWNSPGEQWLMVNYTDINGCRAATSTQYYVSVNPLPGNAGSISGPTTVNAGAKDVSYSITGILNSSEYVWDYSGTGVIIKNGNTNNPLIDFDANATSGNLTVKGANECGYGLQSSLSIEVNPCQVTYPSANGIVWIAGDIYEISWSGFIDPYVRIELLKGVTVVRTIASSRANTGSMSWRVASLPTGNDYKIRITSTANPTMTDESDDYFSIVPAARPKVNYPSEPGIVWNPGTIYEITWQDFTDPYVRIELLKGSSVVRTITTATINDGTLHWKAASLPTGNNYKIRISSTATPTMTDESDNYLTIQPAASPMVFYPSAANIVWNPGTIYEITWLDFTDPYVRVELLKGSVVVRTITTATANDGSMLWKVAPLTPGNDYRIRITSAATPAMTDLSDNLFAIQPAASPMVTYPSAAGIVWVPGTIYEIKWENYTDPYVRIELLKGGTVVRTVASSRANSGSMNWRAPALESGNDYRIRVTSTTTPAMTDESDNNFRLSGPPMVTYPSATGIVWEPGTIYEITWQDFTDPYVKIELLKGGSLVRTVTTSTPNDGTMLWRAPAITPGNDYKIQITSTATPTMTDLSDNNFSISGAKSATIAGNDPGWNDLMIYPNPFTDRVTIGYSIAEKGRTLVEIFDLTGRRVTILHDAVQEADTYELQWDATDASGQQVISGIYLCRIQSGGFVKTEKLVLSK
jgi:bacillopeptidase F (M6 metalloprotease family)